MKGGLSALKFVRNNKKQVWVMIIALSLTFMAMYIINFILMTTKESFKAIFIEQPKKVAFVNLTPGTMGVMAEDYETNEEYNEGLAEARSTIADELKKHEGISNVIFTQVLTATYQAVFGSVGYDFPLMEKEEIPEYLEHMEALLTGGRLPENPGEILVDEKVLKNNKMEIGGIFMESMYGSTFTICGTVRSKGLICVGIPYGYTNTGWDFVIMCDEKNCDMTEVLNDIGREPTEDDIIYDSVDWKRLYDELVVDMIDVAFFVILIVIMVFLALSILVAYISFLRSRVNEYCLYASIGYGKTAIYGMVMREISIIFGLSIVIGAVITMVVMALMGHFILDKMGLVYRYFYPQQLLRILTAFAVIVGVLQIPVAVAINKIKTVDMIEE